MTARDLVHVNTGYPWTDEEWRKLTIAAQLVGLLCMTLRKTGPCNITRLARRGGWPRDVVAEALEELSKSAYSWVAEGNSKRRRMPYKVSRIVFERDGYSCRHCGAGADLSVDHIQPFSRGGSDDLDNLQTLCRPCNSRKGNRINALVQDR